jgi:hypothetical protein
MIWKYKTVEVRFEFPAYNEDAEFAVFDDFLNSNAVQGWELVQYTEVRYEERLPNAIKYYKFTFKHTA